MTTALLSHARRNVIAYLALFVALGGTSYAAVSLPANSVGGKQLKKNAVTSKKVKDGSLLRVDFKAGQLPAGPRGATGPQGAQGVPGAQGPAGPAIVNQLNRVEATKSVAAGAVDGVTVTCPAGQGVVSGAFEDTVGVVFIADTLAGPASVSPNSWSVVVDNFGSSASGTVTAIAFCAPSGQAAAPRTASRDVRSKIDAAVAARRATH